MTRSLSEDGDNSTALRRCIHFVKKKNRQCKLTPMKNELFCGEHIIFASKTDNIVQENSHEAGTSGCVRVRCPLDPKHTVDKSKLRKHLKICNSRDPIELVHFKKFCNTVPLNDQNEEDSNMEQTSETSGSGSEKAAAPEAAEVFAVVEKLRRNLESLMKSVDDIQTQFLQHPKVFLDDKERDLESKKGKEAFRHVSQISSLLQKVENEGYFEDVNKTVLIEMGAGRGQLSYWASLVCDQKLPVLLVDNANIKNKFDHHHKYDAPDLYQRINMDIAHLDLSQVPFLNSEAFTSEKKKYLMMTKHLCGAATDFAITCAVNFASKTGKPVPDILLSFCCHHRCCWKSYVGKQFFLDNGLNRRDFEVMCRISAWYTCGDKWHSKNDVIEESRTDLPEVETEQTKPEMVLKFEKEEKELIGKQCKFLINYGRMKYLESLNMKCEMFYYADVSITLENVALMAKSLN